MTKRLKRGRVQLDCLALKKALDQGTLSDAERKVAESLLPGICAKLAPARPGER